MISSRNMPFPKKSVLLKYLFTYAAILLFPCLLLGLFFFNNAAKQINQNSLDTYQQKAEQLSTSLDKEFDSMMEIIARISSNNYNEINSNIVFWPYKWIDNKYNRTKVIYELDILKKNSPLIGDLILYYKNYDQAFTSTFNVDIETLMAERILTENDLELYNAIKTSSSSKLFRDTFYDLTVLDSYEVLIYTVPFNLEKIQTKDMSLTFILPFDQLDSWTSLILGTVDYSIDFLSDENNILLTYGSKDEYLTETTYSLSDFDNGPIQIKSGDKMVSLFKTYSEELELTTIIKISGDKTLEELLVFRRITIIIIVITIISGLLLIILFSYLNYKPLKILLRLIKEQIPTLTNSESQNEYDQIKSVIDASIVRNKNLEDRINKQNSAFYKEILSNLLYGNISYENLEKTFDISVNLPGPLYSVVALRTNIKLPLELALSDMNKQLKIACVEMPLYKCTAVIISFNNNNDKLEDFIHVIHETLSKTAYLSIGVSKAHNSISDLKNCMIEAYIALEYLESHYTDMVVFYTDSIGKEFRLDLASESNMFALTQSLKAGKKDQCIKALETITSSKEYSDNHIISLFQNYQLANAVLETINELNIKETKVELNLLGLYQDSDMFSRNIKIILSQICDHIMATMTNVQTDPFIEIYKFINDHYLEYDLSLDKLSSDFGLSVSMISKLFKNHIGIGFKQYLIKKRMDTAKNLLCNTDMSVREITYAIGYTNESHFIKKFKLSENMTPLQFKDTYR